MAGGGGPGFLPVSLQFADELPPVVREELELLIAALQRASISEIPIQNIPDGDIRIDASQIVSGILGVRRGGTGVDGSLALNGQLLIGSQTLHGFVLARLTAGPGMTITNGAGSITLSASNNGVVYAPLSTGAEPLQIMSDGAGNVMMVAFDP